MDFTFKTYAHLLKALKASDYETLTFADYCQGKRPEAYVMLRHDVEKHYRSALRFAEMLHFHGMVGSFYFRFTKHFNASVVRSIALLGHEIGYHYDDLTACGGDEAKALVRFEAQLKRLRALADVQTMTMEGAPRSRYDNKDLWIKRDYKDYGIIGEPYFDIDFDSVFYLTDTGRRWDGWKMSVRDKVPQQAQWTKDGLVFHSTQDIIDALGSKSALPLHGSREQSKYSGTVLSRMPDNHAPFPDHLMMTFHPQRWHHHFHSWLKELLFQNLKNIVKRLVVKSH